MAEQTVDPMEALKVILEQLTDSNRQQMMEFAKELKKPSDREQAKLDEEESRLKRAQRERLELGQAEEQRKKNQQNNCGHVRYHPLTGTGGHLWRAQTYTPRGVAPYMVPICLGCNMEGPKIPATADMLREGVALHKYPGITLDALNKWAEQYKA